MLSPFSGTIPGGSGGVRDAGLEQETYLCPFWCTPSPLEHHFFPGLVERLPKAKSLKLTDSVSVTKDHVFSQLGVVSSLRHPLH